MMDGMMGLGWLCMLLGILLLIALIVLVVILIMRVAGGARSGGTRKNL